MINRGRRRGLKSLLVEPYKQVKIGLIFLLLNFTFSFLIIAIFGYYVWDIYTAISEYFQLSQQESADTLRKFSIPIIAGSILMLIFIILTLWVSIKYTHHIYGPMVSVNRHLDEILEGKDPKPLKLREKDQLGGIADKINQVIEMYNSKR